jgi:transcriptional regulator with XRE-family HTH domain
MSKFTEKLNQLAQDAPKSSWKEKIEERKAAAVSKKSIKVAIKLNRILRQKGMKQKELAELLGVSAQQVSKILKGGENLTLDTIERIESTLGIELITILREDEKIVKATTGNFTQSQNFQNKQAIYSKVDGFDDFEYAYADDNNALVG